MPKFYEKIEGWTDFTPFYERMVKTKRGVFVEIGIWQGRSTVFMAELIKERQAPITFWAIDNFEGSSDMADYMKGLSRPLRQIFHDNVAQAEVADYVHLLEGDSAGSSSHFEDRGVDFAFIDASHVYEAVKRDITAWWPKIKSGGILAGHDYHTFGGVTKAVRELAASENLDYSVTCGSTWYVTRP